VHWLLASGEVWSLPPPAHTRASQEHAGDADGWLLLVIVYEVLFLKAGSNAAITSLAHVSAAVGVGRLRQVTEPLPTGTGQVLHGCSCLCLQSLGGFQDMHCMMQYVQYVHSTELWCAVADYKALQPHQPSEVVFAVYMLLGPVPQPDMRFVRSLQCAARCRWVVVLVNLNDCMLLEDGTGAGQSLQGSLARAMLNKWVGY
jgi:hypothetical protein